VAQTIEEDDMSMMLPTGPPQAGDPGAPPDQGAGIPPELLAALQGASPGAGPGPDQGPPVPNPDVHLRNAIREAQAALVGEPDDADSAQLAQIVKDLYGLLAKRQNSHVQAMGGNPAAMRAMSRASLG
jgi:hypothetical protein